MTHYDSKHLSFSELGEAIEKLSKADWLRLRKVANKLSKKCGLSNDDLLQEAFTRTLEGKRRCPRSVNMVRFLAETMKSIASSNVKSFTRHPEFSLQTPKDENGNDYQAVLENPKQLTPEDATIERIGIAKIQKIVSELFKSDSEPMQYLVMGILDGMDAGELQEFSGLHGTEYNSARRLFRRRIEKAFPGGWDNV